jgi:hypothetical protein
VDAAGVHWSTSNRCGPQFSTQGRTDRR